MSPILNSFQINMSLYPTNYTMFDYELKRGNVFKNCTRLTELGSGEWDFFFLAGVRFIDLALPLTGRKPQ